MILIFYFYDFDFKVVVLVSFVYGWVFKGVLGFYSERVRGFSIIYNGGVVIGEFRFFSIYWIYYNV